MAEEKFETYTQEKSSKLSKKIIIAVSCLIIISVVLGLSFYLYNTRIAGNKDVVIAEIGKDKIYLSEYKERLFVKRGGTPEKPIGLDSYIKEPILNELIDQKIIEKEMQQRGIVISESEISQKAKELNKKNVVDEVSLNAFKDASRYVIDQEKLKDKVLTWKEGYILYCRFDHPGNEAKQKPYAQKYCQDMKTRLESGQSKLENELPKLNSDPVIGADVWLPKSISQGAMFNKERPLRNSGGSGDEAVQVSKIAVNNSYNFITIKGIQSDNKDKELSYAVVYIKDKGSNGETTDFDSWLNEQMSKYAIKKYMERIQI